MQIIQRSTLVISNGLRYYCQQPLATFTERGILKEVFPKDAREKLGKLLSSQPQHIYAGFDPTADSLHVGNLLVILGLIRFQRAGHIPIALLGGATGRIGDPSGRTKERPAMDIDEVNHNINSIRKQIERIFGLHGKHFWHGKSPFKLNPVKIVNNVDWYKDMKVLEFVGDVGRHFRMGDMLCLKSVKDRLESAQGINFTEFTYQMFQSYDWLQLYQQYHCKIQLGGSDQLGNLSAGYHLIDRVTSKSVYGITMPILTTRGGKKFGKSEGNAVWLDAKRTSPFSFYQYFLRLEDDEIEDRLKVFSFRSMDEITAIMAQQREATHLRVAQKQLAEDLTLLVHGEKGLRQAENTTKALYDGDFEALSTLSFEEIKNAFDGAPILEFLLEPGMTILDVALKAKCFKDEREATRLISAGGFYINQNRCKNIAEVISPSVHILRNNMTLLRVGKRNYFLIKWSL